MSGEPIPSELIFHGLSALPLAGRRRSLSWVAAAATVVIISRRRNTHRNDRKSAVMRIA